MQVVRVKCDNPRCVKIAMPENQDPYAPPYGWFIIHYNIMGLGPAGDVEVCSLKCIENAIRANVTNAERP